jgi:Protein of unknown function (DUF1573)
MKKLTFITLLVSLLSTACKQLPQATEANQAMSALDPANLPLKQAPAETVAYDTTTFTTLQWIDPVEKEIGKLIPGKEVEVTWKFRNSGDRPLIIEHVGAACGCTVPEKPEQPFAPGQTGTIRVKYNGSGDGFILKQVYVTANTKPSREHTLAFKAEVTNKK